MNYLDYLFKFPVSGLALALTALPIIVTAERLKIGTVGPQFQNALGDLRDNSGAIVPLASATWRGRQGGAGSSSAAHYYVQARSVVTGADLAGFVPASYGIIGVTAAEIADVLGVWA